MTATKQTIAILIGYLTCDDPVIKTKYENLLASFYHKDEGLVVKSVDNDGSGGTDMLFSDGNTVNFPVLPNSKPISFITGLLDALNLKVDKVTGKQLSTEDFTTDFKNKLNSLTNYIHPETHLISEVQDLQTALDAKVDKVAGKQLSTEDFTTDFKNKLNSITPNVILNTEKQWFKGVGNTEPLIHEAGDSVMGYIEGEFVYDAIYLVTGTNIELKTSYDIRGQR